MACIEQTIDLWDGDGDGVRLTVGQGVRRADADDRMAGLVAAFACALASLSALAFTFAFMSPK